MDGQDHHGDGPQIISTSAELEVLCGPLLNYQRLAEEESEAVWYGSVLLVTKPGQKLPPLTLKPLGALDGVTKVKSHAELNIEGLKLYSDPDKAFWRFTLRVPLVEAEARWQYSFDKIQFLADVKNKDPSREFVVPASTDSFRIMFHSCNGFSVGTDEDFWNGKPIRPIGEASRPAELMVNRSCTVE